MFPRAAVTMTSVLQSHSTRGQLAIGLATAWIASVAAAMLVARATHLSSAYPLKSGVVFGVVTILVAIGVGRHPLREFGAANRITTGRAAIVALLAALVGEAPRPEIGVAAALAGTAAMLLDGVDGWIARRLRIESGFGARFDMETDALLILVLSLLVWQHGKAGVWIVLAGLLRYLFVGAGLLLPRLNAPLAPSVRRKAVCVVQIAGLGLALLPSIAPPQSVWLSAALVGLLAYSFLADTVWLWRRVE